MIGGISLSLWWALLGIFLIIFEITTPGMFIIFFGFGALLTAFTTYIGLTTSFASGLLVFSISSLLFLFALRRFFKKTFGGKQQSNDNQSFEIEIGQLVTVVEDILPDRPGRVRYQGTEWKAASLHKLSAGETARLKGRDNLTLIVEPLADSVRYKEQ